MQIDILIDQYIDINYRNKKNDKKIYKYKKSAMVHNINRNLIL